MAGKVDLVERARIRLAVDFVLLLAEEKTGYLLLMPASNMTALVSGLNSLMNELIARFPEMSPCSLVLSELYGSLRDEDADDAVIARIMGWGVVQYCVLGLGYKDEEMRSLLLKLK